MKTYKLWLDIELHDSEGLCEEEYKNVESFQIGQEFETLAEAEAAADMIRMWTT